MFRFVSTRRNAVIASSSSSLHQLLTFPEAYTQFQADAELEQSSVNIVGRIVPHLHQAERNKAFRDLANKSAVPIRAWVRNVPVDREALVQLDQLSTMGGREGIIRHPIVVMPDVHCAQAATVGTVIPTTKAVIPAAAGVDLGCGIMVVRTSLREQDLPEKASELETLRLAIELAIPHGRTHNGDPANDAGGWRGDIPPNVARIWKKFLEPDLRKLMVKYDYLEKTNNVNHLGSMGTGNHFCELCVDDESKSVWILVHSGSRGVGNKIGSMFIEQAKKDMGNLISNLPNADLAYFREGTEHFDEYCFAVDWAQRYAQWNRHLMIENAITSLRATQQLPPFSVVGLSSTSATSSQVPSALEEHLMKTFEHNDVLRNHHPFFYAYNNTAEQEILSIVDCHHNYITKQKIVVGDDTNEEEEVIVTRKGATSAQKGEYAIIPGSMGARSYIVRGKGNAASYCSCSHGAGRRYSRSESTRRFTLDDHIAATEGIVCRKDKDILDESPGAYKSIDDVMKAQEDCVEIIYTLRQKICVKG